MQVTQLTYLQVAPDLEIVECEVVLEPGQVQHHKQAWAQVLRVNVERFGSWQRDGHGVAFDWNKQQFSHSRLGPPGAVQRSMS
jgi:hypothetical protein